MSNIVSWRKRHLNEFTSRFGFKLNYTPFFLEATAKALAMFPKFNASIDGDNIVYKRDIHIGCAVALGTEGLIVPVIRSADKLSLTGLAESLQGLAEKARTKALAPDATSGGTFTVTNAGTFGSILSYPIINQPQMGILGIGAIKKRPVVVSDLIGIRDICFITLSYDHRLIDGSLAGRFLQQISSHLENWDINRGL
jgi:2-oxoglutarate dehydrogenase E2 component (dihydrolipoamide succinyltransferase)